MRKTERPPRPNIALVMILEPVFLDGAHMGTVKNTAPGRKHFKKIRVRPSNYRGVPLRERCAPLRERCAAQLKRRPPKNDHAHIELVCKPMLR